MSKLTPRKQPLQARSQQTMAAILEAAGQVLEREGVARATTHRIAERAGVSVGSVYQYFPNKDAIFAELYRRYAEQIEPAIASLSRSIAGGTPLADVIVAATELFVARLRRAPGVARALVEHRAEILPAEEKRRRQNRVEARLAQALAGWPEPLRVADLSLAAFVISRSWEAVIVAAVSERPESLEDGSLVSELSALLSRYLLASPPPRLAGTGALHVTGD